MQPFTASISRNGGHRRISAIRVSGSSSFCREIALSEASETSAKWGSGFFIIDRMVHFVDIRKPIPHLAQVSKMANTEQVAVLRDKGITAWNNWRKAHS
jgi:hypothetical protein